MVPALPAQNPVLVLVIGVAFAAFTSVAAAFAAEYLDPSFRTPGEVGEILGIPVLASFPRRAAL